MPLEYLSTRALQNLFVIFSFAFLLTSHAAELPPLTADDPPLDEKQKATIRSLITQLGDNSWEKRNAASQSLERIGEPALPFLKEVLEHNDAEIRARASDLVKSLEIAPKIQDVTIICAPGGLNITGNLSSVGSGHLVLTTQGVAGVTVLTTAEFSFKGRQFNVVRKTAPDGSSIEISYTEKSGDTQKKHTITATDESEFEKKDPVVYKIYLKILGNVAQRQAEIRRKAATAMNLNPE